MAEHLKAPDSFAPYDRVAVAWQGRGTLRPEAPRPALLRAGKGGTAAEALTGIESGRNAVRPRLAEALDACRLTRGGAAGRAAGGGGYRRPTGFRATRISCDSQWGVCRRRDAERQPAGHKA